MKIVLYVNSFLPSIGGREIVVHYLARELKNLGHEVRVVGASGWWKNRKLKFDYPVHRYPSLRSFFPRHVRFLQLLFDVWFFGADVINAHATFPAGYIAGKLKKITKIALVITPHGEDINIIPDLGYGLRLDPKKEKYIKQALQDADEVTAISDTITDSILEVIPGEKKITTIANGFDNMRFAKKVDADVFSWLGIPSTSRLILTVGTNHPHKGQSVIVNAMPKILESCPQARLIMVGAKTDGLTPLIKKLKLDKKVILTGKIGFPALDAIMGSSSSAQTNVDWLAALYQQSELYISAGTKDGAEGLSLAVLDAMGAGLPVVATRISGNKDVVDSYENGILVEPGSEDELANAVCEILASSDLQKMMGKKARDRVKEYHWENIAKEYLVVYQKVLEKQN